MNLPTVVVFPLRSNAKQMVTGAPISGVRRRLKFASVFYDVVLLEHGALGISAGPTLTWRVPLPVETTGWQTPRQRFLQQRAPFSIGIGQETTPGVPAERMDTVMSSDTSFSWVATFEPFRAELPIRCDWIAYVQPSYTDFSVVRRLADDWIAADKANPALERALPAQLARGQVIDGANLDLASIATAQPRMTASLDPLHMQVVAQRLAPDSGWRVHGFALPVLLPRVGDLPWDSVADLRKNKHIARLREVLREIESDGLGEALTGAVEAAAHHAFERFLIEGTPQVTAASVASEATLTMVVSAGASAATFGLSPTVPGSIGAATAVGQTVSSGVIKRYRAKRRDGWLTIAQGLR